MSGIVRHTRSSSSSGFTLLEIVVALAILSTGLVMLLESHFATLMLAGDAQLSVTENVLLEQVVFWSETQVLLGEESGDGAFGDRHEGYRYAFQAEEVDEETRPGLWTVSVALETPTGMVDRSFMVYRDPGEDADEG